MWTFNNSLMRNVFIFEVVDSYIYKEYCFKYARSHFMSSKCTSNTSDKKQKKLHLLHTFYFEKLLTIWRKDVDPNKRYGVINDVSYLIRVQREGSRFKKMLMIPLKWLGLAIVVLFASPCTKQHKCIVGIYVSDVPWAPN